MSTYSEQYLDELDELKWVESKEFADGSGRSLFTKPYDMFTGLTYFPAENRAWYDDGFSDHAAVSFRCESWAAANDLYERLKENYR